MKRFMFVAIVLSMLFAPAYGVFAAQQIEMGGELKDKAFVAVATIVAVDKETRALTLKGEDEEKWTFIAGPEVRNFDQIKRGDRVIMEYFEGMAIALGPKGSGIRERVDKLEVERAKSGEKPAGKITKTVEALGMVVAVSPKEHLVALKGAERTVVLGVSDDVDLSQVKVGQEVVAVYVQSLAVSVEPAPKVSGTVSIESKSIAIGIGVQWGHGTLTMDDGSTHKFKVNGLSLLDLGITKIKASGEVFHLVEAKDLAGVYISGEAGAALIGGGSVIAMKNENGVVLQLKSTQQGVKLTLAGQGLKITMVE